MVGNKNDMYEVEEVEENEGKAFAKELGAIFQKTSAKEATGVEDLFIKIGQKILNPNDSDGASAKPEKKDKKKIKLDKSQDEERKRKEKENC